MSEIATHTKIYSSFPDLSYWFDMKKLYKQLEIDTTFRLSNDTLNNFYDSLQNEAIMLIDSAESRMNAIVESMESMDHDLYLQRIEEAQQTNSNIVSTEDQELYQQEINAIYLKWLEFGHDSISSSDSVRIKELALMCPYIGGSAVYLARSLYAMFNPAYIYDDIEICNAIGVYKNGSTGGGKGIFDDENDFLRHLDNRVKRENLEQSALVIHPNPANTQINISYSNKEDTKLQIINILGIVEKEILLPAERQRVSVLITDLFQGVYIYRQLNRNRIIRTGKLIISN